MEDFNKEILSDNSAKADWQLPTDLEDKIVGALRERGAFSPKTKWWNNVYLKAAAAIFLLILSFGGGWLWGSDPENNTVAINDSKFKKYALLLYNDENFINTDSHTQEYAEWFQANMKAGLEYGEELSDERLLINSEKTVISKVNTSDDMVLSGFFMISSSSVEEATRIAGTCPHLKYNGRIEIRQVVQ